jgi:transposase-like protein
MQHYYSLSFTTCANSATFMVDRGAWYKRASETLGLDYYHETFDERDRVEKFFRTFKRRTKVFACEQRDPQ